MERDRHNVCSCEAWTKNREADLCINLTEPYFNFSPSKQKKLNDQKEYQLVSKSFKDEQI